jgi:hypothetical protein
MKTAKAIKFAEIMRAERRVDVYGGDSCEEHIPRWWMYAEGDKDSDESREPLTLRPENFPAGTLVTVEIPVCPDCGTDAQMCDCGFDWKKWAEDIFG